MTEGVEFHLADLAGLRQGLYRLAALGAMAPDSAVDQEVRDILAALAEEDRLLAMIPWYPAYRHLSAGLEELATMPDDARKDWFKEIDDPPRSSGRNGARESTYLMMGGLQAGELIGRLEGRYRETGLEWDHASGIAPDGAAVQLDYLRYLCALEAMAWEAEDRVQAHVILDREAGFLGEHVGTWYVDHIDGILASLALPEPHVAVLSGTRDLLRGDMTLIATVRNQGGPDGPSEDPEPINDP